MPPLRPSRVRFLQLSPPSQHLSGRKHLSKDLNTKGQKSSLSSTKVLMILNRQESFEKCWSFQKLSVEMVKEEEKKIFFFFWKNHMIILSPKTQQLESVSEGSRDASLENLHCPGPALPTAWFLLFLPISEASSCFLMTSRFCLSYLPTVFVVCNWKCLHWQREFLKSTLAMEPKDVRELGKRSTKETSSCPQNVKFWFLRHYTIACDSPQWASISPSVKC